MIDESPGDTFLLTTERLRLRRITPGDAGFVLRLCNEPAFLRFIGDKGVRDLESAERYILEGPVDSYCRHGFGMYMVERRSDGAELGFCGLVKRAELEDVDIGFAFLPEYWSQGYARESALAVLAHARDDFALCRIVAITLPDNHASIRLLESLGLEREGRIIFGEQSEKLLLFATPAGSGSKTQ